MVQKRSLVYLKTFFIFTPVISGYSNSGVFVNPLNFFTMADTPAKSTTSKVNVVPVLIGLAGLAITAFIVSKAWKLGQK